MTLCNLKMAVVLTSTRMFPTSFPCPRQIRGWCNVLRCWRGARCGIGCSVTSAGVWSSGSCLLGLLPFPLPFAGALVVGVVLGVVLVSVDWLGSAVGVLLCKSSVSVEITG